jgi:hypothetical protein
VDEPERQFWISVWLNDAQALGLLALTVGLLSVTLTRIRSRLAVSSGQRSTLTVGGAMLLVAWVGVMLGVVHWFDANFSTVYASSYSEDRFAQVRVGMTREEVDSLLGSPLRMTPKPSENWRPGDAWIYSEPPGPGLWGDNFWRRWVFFCTLPETVSGD